MTKKQHMDDIDLKTSVNKLTITTSRYMGTYSGGHFIAIGGVQDVKEQTRALDTDTACGKFWEEAPIVKTENGKTVFATADDTIIGALSRLKEIVQAYNQGRIDQGDNNQ